MSYIQSHNSIINKIVTLLFTILYIIELNWLLIDSISGFFQLNSIQFFNSLNISGMARIALFFVGSIVIILEFSKNIMSNISLFALFALFALFLLLVSGHFIFYDSDNLLKDTQGSLRLFFLFFLFIIVKIQIKNHMLTKERYEKILKFNFSIVMVNIFLGATGIGFSKYGINNEGLIQGAQGFIFSGNELNTVIVTLMGLYLYYIQDKTNKIIVTILAIFMIIAILSFSKTVIFAYVLMATILLLYNIKKIRYIKFIFIVIALTFIFSYVFQDILIASYNRTSYFIDSSDFLTGITSNRISRIGIFVDLFLTNIWTFLFGVGYGQMNMEMDFFDVLVSYGLVTFMFVYGFLFTILKTYLLDRRYRLVGYFIIIILLISSIAGHVLFSAMNSLFFALLLHQNTIKKSLYNAR
jgi:hypothetical protein